MSLEALLSGIGAVLTAAVGLLLIIREFRHREHKAARAEVASLTRELYDLDQAYIAFRRYAHKLRQMLADQGIDAPEAPPLHEYTNGLASELASAFGRGDVRSERRPDVRDGGDRGDRRAGGE